jgi:ABC-type bacteriocin/lantibiotic exporter with double-glycine peptidase domain
MKSHAYYDRSTSNVSLRYPNESQDALTGISIEIKTGEFVLLVGVNGSGKSSLLKVLAGLLPPTSGEVKVNQRAFREYAPSTIRQAISFVTHSEPIYPLSLAENIFIGLGEDLAQRGLTTDARQRMVHEAAEIVGCTQLLQRLGEDTILNPCRVVNTSLKGCGNGDIGKAAYREWKRNDPSQCLHTLSPGEKQRLIL